VKDIDGITAAQRILQAWIDLEAALRRALPLCAVAPPTQPAELLAALRVAGRIGPEEEEEVMALREHRNRVAHQPGEPSADEVLRYEIRVAAVKRRITAISGTC
jgi:uncharacterized protein YutE (UPF0331/DUF86 family)